MSKKGCMFRITAFACLACVFLNTSGCADKNNDSGAYDSGMEALENGNYDTALSEFQKAVDEDGRAAEGYRGMGLVYLNSESYEYAVNMFDLSISSMKHDNDEFERDVLLYKAEALADDSKTDEALEIYKELENGPAPEAAYALEGRIYLNNGQRDKAADCFDLALGDGDDIKIALFIYEAYKDANLEGDGAAYLEKAISSNVSEGEDEAFMGLAYYYLNDYENAITYLNKAIKSGYSNGTQILGNIYLDKGDISGARALFMDMISAGGNDAMAYNGLAMCSMAEEDYESALVYIDLGLKCNDKRAERSLLFNEVAAYEKMLDFNTAKTKSQEYLVKYPNDMEMKNESMFLLHS